MKLLSKSSTQSIPIPSRLPKFFLPRPPSAIASSLSIRKGAVVLPADNWAAIGVVEPSPAQKAIRACFDSYKAAILEDDGMAIFSGCSHNGILNMVETATARFPGTPVKAVFGGFHLIGLPKFNTMAASPADVESIAREMMTRIDGTVFTGHCTGTKAFGVLGGVMGDALRPLSTGASVQV